MAFARDAEQGEVEVTRHLRADMRRVKTRVLKALLVAPEVKGVDDDGDT
jgi:hypothetical protein